MPEEKQKKIDLKLAEIKRKMIDIIDAGYFCEVSFKVCYGQITDWKVAECGHEDLEKN